MNSSDAESFEDDRGNIQAEELGPPPKRAKHPGRKKTRRSHLWKSNIAKSNGNESKSYIDRKGNQHGGKQIEAVKESYYRYLFNNHFNLSFHKPHTDTCVTCDGLQTTIDNGQPHEKEAAQTKKNYICVKQKMPGNWFKMPKKRLKVIQVT
ncbi:hypothetical protein J6590_105536 [Homalodisca vitripennis]|nr:hypothetical protein J6590_105536 [Homalodisca vitripennis]